MSLYNTANDLLGLPVLSHTASSASIVLGVDGTAFPAPPFRVTLITHASYGSGAESKTRFGCSAVATNTPTSGQCTLTVAVIEGSADQNYTTGDYAELRLTAAAINDLNIAVNALELAVGTVSGGQPANRFVATPDGSTGGVSLRAIVGADLPNPSSSTLGGTRSIAAVSHNFLTAISTSGIPAQAQPAFSDISGSVAASQLPNPSASTLGGVQSAAAVSHQFLTSISTSGVPTLAQPAFSDISGTATTGQLPTIPYSQLSGVTGPHLFTAILGQGSAVATGTNSAGNYLICPKAGTFTRWDIACVTGPTGASLIVDVMKSANQGSTWTSLWASNPGNRPTVAAAANNGGGTSFDTGSFSAGDWLRFDVIQVGSTIAGQNVTVVVTGSMGQ